MLRVPSGDAHLLGYIVIMPTVAEVKGAA